MSSNSSGLAMHYRFLKMAVASIIFVSVTSGCSDAPETGEHEGVETLSEERDAHDREGRAEHGNEGEHGKEEGEESGTEYALDATYNMVRGGVRLIMSYDEKDDSFKGTVENVTNRTLSSVRVEVHLSNGTELGPTSSGDLDPGQQRAVELKAIDKPFDGWTPHAEVGRGEHGGRGGQN